MSSSSGSLTLTSPRSSGTTHSVVMVHPQPSMHVKPQLNLKLSHSKESVRRQICVVVRNLESVVSELNSVMNELHGVLEQIDIVTGCLDARIAGKSFNFQHSLDDEKLWTTRRKRSVSSGCSLSSHVSQNSSTSTSSSSTDLSSLWKLPRKARSRSSSSGRQSRKSKKTSDLNSNTSQEKRNHNYNSNNTTSKRSSKLFGKHEPHELTIGENKCKEKSKEDTNKVRLRDKKRSNKRAFLHGFCCVRTQSMYSADSDPRRSCVNDEGTWVLRKGNGVQSPMYPGNVLPEISSDKISQQNNMPKSFSEGNISSCSSRGKRHSQAMANLKLPNGHVTSIDETPVKTSGIASLSDETLHTNSSCSFLNRSDMTPLIMTFDSDEYIPLMTYLKSPVSSAQMHRRSDLLGENHGYVGPVPRPPNKHEYGTSSYSRKPKNGIYQYESETEISQKDATLSDHGTDVNGVINSPLSDPSVTVSIGPTLSEIEPDMVETDGEVEFSLMPTISTENCYFENQKKKSNSISSFSSPSDGETSLGDSLTSLEEREKLERKYWMYSYDSEADTDVDAKCYLTGSTERELAAEGLKLLLYGDKTKSSEDISEQKRKIIAELDNLNLSFNSDASTPESENGKLLRSSLTQFDDFSPDSPPLLNLSSAITSNSTGNGNGETLLSHRFESDPEVKAFLQELDKKIQANHALQSVDDISVFTGSDESLAVSDTIFSSKLGEAVLDVNSNIKLNSIFKGSMDSVLTDDSKRRCSSDPGDSDMMESFEWEHSFTFSMYQETGSKIPDFSPEAGDADKTLDSSFSQNFDLDETLTYSLSYPLEKAKSASLSSESFIWSEGSVTSERRLDSTGKSVDELLSELDISTDLLSKSSLKRPDTLVPSLDHKNYESLPRSEGNGSDYKVSYNRDINTWTAFAMVHIGDSDSNLSRCSVVSDGASQASGKSNNLFFSPPDVHAATTTTTTTETRS